VVRLQPLLDHIRELLENLDFFSCSHIYRKFNSSVDRLSKDALRLDNGVFLIYEFHEGLLLEEKYFIV
jgi:hypothetical protein